MALTARSAHDLNGTDKAALLMLALGEEHGAKLWELMDDEEIKEVSMAMASLGQVDARMVENLIVDFAGQMSSTGALIGTLNSTERLLQRILPEERVELILEEIRGPAGRTMWDKLGNVTKSCSRTI